jgi:RNA polymerase sigma-70 factor, ECF subfamily
MLVVAEREQLPVAEARAGNPAAWDVLFKRYQLPLYVYAIELVHDQQAALDIVQETFINASRYIRNLREEEKFGGWLFGIAHQKCIQLWRKLGREEMALKEYAIDAAELDDSADQWLLRKEQESELMELINQLPAAQRSVLLLYFLEDFSLDQIAEITGAATGTVKSRLHYAKKALKKLLYQRHENAS